MIKTAEPRSQEPDGENRVGPFPRDQPRGLRADAFRRLAAQRRCLPPPRAPGFSGWSFHPTPDHLPTINWLSPMLHTGDPLCRGASPVAYLHLSRFCSSPRPPSSSPSCAPTPPPPP